MQPTYFPFTYISKRRADAITSFFRPLIVYQPDASRVYEEMQAMAAARRLDLRITALGEEEALERTFRAYQQWITTHRGVETEFLKTRRNTVPFFDDFSVAQIRSSIKRQAREVPSDQRASQKEGHRMFAARLFLRLAQEFDYQSIGLEQQLFALQETEKELFRQLKGQDEVLGRQAARSLKTAPDADPGAHMIRARMQAWARLFHCDPQKSPLLVTSSPAAVDIMLKAHAQIKSLVSFDTVLAGLDEAQNVRVQEWIDDLNAKLHCCLTIRPETQPVEFKPFPRADTHGNRAVKISFFMAPQLGPEALLRPFLTPDPPQPDSNRRHPDFQNSLIGLIEN